MRLTETEREAIKSVIFNLDPEAKIFLFGSRVDDSKKGGDIDLLILSTKIGEQNRRSIKLSLYDKLGEQKIDLVIAADTSKPFVRIALAEGLPL